MIRGWTALDYGAGNLHSLRKALATAGVDLAISTDPHEVAAARVAVLPGVGAFGAVMDRIAPAGLALRKRHDDGRPLLGICIGAQVLYEASDESLGAKGLGIVPGTVRRLPANDGKVPHMGWNTLASEQGLPGDLFDGVPEASHVYYVHSYAAAPGPGTVATTRYGTVFTAALRSRSTVGLQFHPEKSSAVGRRILANAVATLEDAAR